MSRHKLYIFDLDGTIYRGAEAIENAASTVERLLEEGALVRYVTNNSGAIPEKTSAKLMGLGVMSEPGWVYSAGTETARYCRDQGYKKAFIVGEENLRQIFRSFGLEASDQAEFEPDCVVSGICRSFTYDLLRIAMAHILNGSPWITTNLDPTYPLEHGRLEPGSGAMAASIQCCTDVTPIVIGKPEPQLISRILDDTGISADQAVVVGDRLDTDIESGKRAGCHTWVVLTGVTKEIPAELVGGNTLADLL